MYIYIHLTKCFLSLAIILFAGQISFAISGKYPIQNFTPSDYKAGIQNIDFAQNRDMNLFVANNLGVLSFNGKEWSTHNFQTGKKKRSLAFDENTNRLFVGSQGEFGYFQKDWQYVPLDEMVPSSLRDFDEVWDVFIRDSQVYFCTFQGIYVFDGNSIFVIEHTDGLERSFQANGKLFSQSSHGKLFEIVDHNLVQTYRQGQTNQIISGLIPHEDGYLIFYQSGQIELTTPFGATPKYQYLSQALQGTYVNHILQLSDTRLAVSTQTSGLFIYDLQLNTIERITSQDGLESDACLRSFQDYSGNLWVGMQSGIAIIYINSPMRLISQDININGSGYVSFESDVGTYYSTSNGIYFLAKNKDQCIFLQGTEGPAYGIQQIAGKLYAAHHTGLFKLQYDKAKRLVTTDGMWRVKQLISNPEYAIGGTYSGLYLFRLDENRELQAVRKIEGFNETSRFFEEDSYGRIWVSQYYKGLYRLSLSDNFTTATSERISDENDIPIQEQIILSRVDNELYIATNAGVLRYDQTKDTFVDAEPFSEIFGKQPIYIFEQDRQNNIHVLAENQVGFFKQISPKSYVFVPSSLYQLRYSLNNDLLHMSIDSDNGVLFSANDGFIHYAPELEDRVSSEKPIVVRRVFSVTQDTILYSLSQFDRNPDNNINLVIDHIVKDIQIDVESYHLRNVSNQQFRYFLKGLDEEYGEWTNSSTKEYTNLKEGKYEFTAQTRNYLGEIATSQTLFLEVKPPIYRTTVAICLYVLLGLSGLFLGFRMQRRRYKRRAKNIEQQKEKEVLALKEEKMVGELRHVNNLLAASTMNLVVKNEFIETIKEELKEVKKRDKDLRTSKALEKIVKEIDTSLRLQEDWGQFEHHFDQVHGDFLSRLRDNYRDLSPNEQKLSALLRLNLNTKEISNLMSISVRGVEVARYRLRQKLSLEKGMNLSKFILEY